MPKYLKNKSRFLPGRYLKNGGAKQCEHYFARSNNFVAEIQNFKLVVCVELSLTRLNLNKRIMGKKEVKSGRREEQENLSS